jgi:hypothetical protein
VLKSGRRRLRQWIIWFVVISVTLIGSIFALSVHYDPYLIFSSADGLPEPANPERARLSAYSYIPKAVQIIRLRPDAVLLGTSVVDGGFLTPGSMVNYFAPDPKSFQNLKALLGPRYPIYNAGLRGKNIEEAWEFLQHVYVNNPHLKHVYLGIDWTMFLNGAARIPLRDSISAIGKKHVMPDYLLQYSLSLPAMEESFAMWAAAHPFAMAQIGGLRRRLLGLGAHTEQSGPAAVAEPGLPQSSGERPRMRPGPPFELDKFIFTAWYFGVLLAPMSPTSENTSAYPVLQQIVDFCQRRHIELKVFVTTKHPFFWAIDRHFGMAPDMEYWFRRVVGIVPVWDFSGAVDFGPEPDAYHLVDTLHFVHAGGELILPEILKDKPSIAGVTIVAPDNVEAVIAQYRSGLGEWRRAHPEYARAIDAVSTSFLRSLDLHQMPSYLPLMPDQYQPEYRGHRIISILGTFVAVPAAQTEPLSLGDLLEPQRYGWPNAPTLKELMVELGRKG